MATDGAWYPVALSIGIERGTSNGTRLFGREIVVWRDADGVAHVWEDRCPHRGMRLSFGFVRGDRIACLYHGWQYDAEGQCRAIPAHPQLTPPETIRVPVLEVTERLGMIWVRNGAPRPGDLPIDVMVTAVRSITVDCAPEAALWFLQESVTPSGGRIGAFQAPQLTPSLVALGDGDERVAVGVQPLSLGESALHIVIAGKHDGAGLKSVNAWAETTRSALERSTEPGRTPA